MAKERLKSPRARLFVALELPSGARKLLREWQRDLEGRAPGELRPVAADALHVTLAFIGYRAERDIEAVARVVADSVPEGLAIDLAFGEDLRARPPRRPKLYAAEVVEVGSGAGGGSGDSGGGGAGGGGSGDSGGGGAGGGSGDSGGGGAGGGGAGGGSGDSGGGGAGGGALSALRWRIAGALAEARLFEDERRDFWPHVTLARVKRSAAKHHRALDPLPGAPAALTVAAWPATAVTLFRSHLEPAGARYEVLQQIDLVAGD